MKTKEELQEIKQNYDLLTSKLQELTEDELKMVIGGIDEFEFQEAEDLSLANKEVKELNKNNKPENKPKTN